MRRGQQAADAAVVVHDDQQRAAQPGHLRGAFDHGGVAVHCGQLDPVPAAAGQQVAHPLAGQTLSAQPSAPASSKTRASDGSSWT